MGSKESIRIQFNAQPMDCALHPSEPLLATGLITGRVQVHRFDTEAGTAKRQLSLGKAHGESCRAVRFSHDGEQLLTGGADMAIAVTDLASGKVSARMTDAHGAGITRLLFVSQATLASGADDGSVKLWDVRQRREVAAFAAHSDFVSDFALHEARHTLLAVSGDGTLSAMDLRNNKVVRSEEDADDEMLSVAVLKGGAKLVVGTGSGTLSIFSWGHWEDCSDRFPGHPSSVDALVALDEDTVISGSEDGLIRVLSVQPHKLLGLVAQGEPIERLALSAARGLLASATHDDAVRIWDVSWLADSGASEEASDEDGAHDSDEDGGGGAEIPTESPAEKDIGGQASSDDSDDEDVSKRRKRKGKHSKGQHKIDSKRQAQSSSKAFFKDLL